MNGTALGADVALPEPATAAAPVAPFSLVPLIDAADVTAVGEKAFTLGRLMRAGVHVPEGVVVTVAAFERYAGAVTGGAPVPRELANAILSAAAPLMAQGPVVVRSSAVGEDAPGQSFAGQLDSTLHVEREAELLDAIRNCWASYHSARARFYRNVKGAPDAGMGVIVQRQVAAQAAGVLFTDIGDGRAMVEFTRGLADALVLGAIDPGRLTIDSRSGAVDRAASAAGYELPDAVVASLARTGAALGQLLGAPQDVEWALSDDGTLFVVQSRPITAAIVAPPVARAGSKRSVSWSNANVNENFPGPISPLLYSIAALGYTQYFRNLARAFGIARRRVDAMEPSFRQIIGVHGARMYYNLTAIHSVLRLAPFGQAMTQSFDRFVGADGAAVVPDSTTRAGRVREVAEAARVAVQTAWQYRTLGRRIARFERTIDAFAARTTPEQLATMTLAELRACLSEFMEIRLHRWLDASLADCAAMVCHGALTRLLHRAYGNDARASVHTSLIKAIPGVVSGEPVRRLWLLSRSIRRMPALRELFERDGAPTILATLHGDARFGGFRAELQTYLDDWGFRCSEELMLTSPSFQENPLPLLEMLRAYARLDDGSPSESFDAQADERRMETERVLREVGGRRLVKHLPLISYRHALRVLIPWTHASIRYRERARLKQALLYSRCRRIVLAMGGQLRERAHLIDVGDVFHLTVSELDELASGSAMFPHATARLVALRRDEQVRASAITPPDAFTLPEGEYLPAAGIPTCTGGEACAGVTERDDRLRGTAACSGTATGRATVLACVTEAAALAPGDILVTRQTDPGWGPVFFLIRGLVIERGGMLSHGAIIAREFGIPCVVGIRDAMRRIPSGATITVDGDRGEVHVAD